MKTNKTLMIVGALALLSLSGAGVVQAGKMNKHVDYRNTVEATKGTVAGESKGWRHLNKFAREQEQKSGIGGTTLSSAPSFSAVPKNFRNTY